MELDMQAFMMRLETMIRERGLKKKTVIEALGLSATVFTDWKSGKGRPTLATAMKVADYFGVSLDYLAYGKESISAEDYEEDMKKAAPVMDRYNRIPPEHQAQVLAYMDGVLCAISTEERRRAG